MKQILLLIVVTSFLACSCSKDKGKDENSPANTLPAITINNHSYSNEEILNYAYFLIQELDNETLNNNKIKKHIINNFINHILLYEAAKKSGIDIEKRRVDELLRKFDSNLNNKDLSTFQELRKYNIDKIKETIYENLVIQAYLNKLIYENVKVDESELLEYYSTNIQQDNQKILYHVWHIFVKDEDKALTARQKLRERNSFEKVAKEYSEDLYSGRGGDMGYIDLDEMPEEFKIIEDMKVKTVSEIVKSNYGYHIFSLRDKLTTEDKPSFDELSGEIYFKVFQKKQSELIENILKELRKDAKISFSGDFSLLFGSDSDSSAGKDDQ